MQSKSYKRPEKTDNTVIQLKDKSIVQIHHFELQNEELFMCVNKFVTLPFEKNELVVNHLLRVIDKEEETKMKIDLFDSKLIYISSKTAEYVCLMPPLLDVK